MEKLYAYREAESRLDELMPRLEAEGCCGAWRYYSRLKLGILLCSRVDYYRSYTEDVEEAVAWTWEDVNVAFRGYGDSFFTGMVVTIASVAALKKEWEDEYIQGVTAAFAAAEAATPPDVKRRYLKQYRDAPVRRLSDGFKLPAILPCFGPPCREWANYHNRDAAKVEEALMYAEELERHTKQAQESREIQKSVDQRKKMRRANPAGGKRKSPILQVISGGLDERPIPKGEKS